MNDHEVAQLLKRRADEVPDPGPPVMDVLAAGRSTQRRRRRLSTIGLAIGAAVVVGLLVPATSGGPRPSGDQPDIAAPAVRVLSDANLIERYPSLTAADWVTTSDYVVVARATREQATYRDSSTGTVGRSVDLNVVDVIWSSPNPSQPLPPVVTVASFGRAEGDIPIAFSGTPRIEPGHDYIIALIWEPTRCAPGDPTEPAHWMPLGSDAVIPFDNARIGYGESEGRTVTGNPGQAGMGSLEERMLGQPLRDLRQALNAARPALPNAPEPTASGTNC